jgi:squalene cyclase
LGYSGVTGMSMLIFVIFYMQEKGEWAMYRDDDDKEMMKRLMGQNDCSEMQ